MTTARLIPMEGADLPATLRLWQHTPGIGLNEGDEPEALRRFLERNPGLSHVARSFDDRLIGAVLCGHDGRRGYLHHLAVVQEARRAGIGTALVGACLGALSAERIPKCTVFVFHDNAAGMGFWTNRGFNAPKWGPLQRVIVAE
jgi:ribosomal protein S18 acetylase RimI-like enzyme